jgi:hypothetical protein
LQWRPLRFLTRKRYNENRRAQNLAKKDTDMRLEDFDNDEDKIIQDRLKQNLERDKNQ